MATTSTKKSACPDVGSTAPAFSAPGSRGDTIKLSDFKGRNIVVLYFYPKDDTPGCTTEACGFRDSFADLRSAGIEVIGVSPDSVASHREFIGKYGLPFPLVADEDHRIAEAYGVWQEKTRFGKTSMGVVRTTFVIDEQGRVAHVFKNVKPEGHEREVLEWIEANL